ncbi:MAG: GTP cyclohydrolase II [Saprospiraceae bacterium]|nr:GTP cyclohydrolase II [Saprospiraceae bacterium]
MDLQNFTRLPTSHGEFKIQTISNIDVENPHLVLINSLRQTSTVNVRIHSECITGDVFASLRCDCGAQLSHALKYINDHGGVLFYLRQEGRGIGIEEKLKAYNLQDEGEDTVSANLKLGHQSDQRTYKEVVDWLKEQGIQKINLLTNNPDKVSYLEDHGITIAKRVSIIIEPNVYNKKYLETKRTKMGHII